MSNVFIYFCPFCEKDQSPGAHECFTIFLIWFNPLHLSNSPHSRSNIFVDSDLHWLSARCSFFRQMSVFLFSVIVLSNFNRPPSFFQLYLDSDIVESRFRSKLLFAVGRSLLVSIWTTCELKCNCSPFSSLSWLFFLSKKWVLSSFTMLPYFQYMNMGTYKRRTTRVGGFEDREKGW